MSENIQSIANGTFTLGQTSATNFEAGPGISITQPSEGTVRIANDETLLFSATSWSSTCPLDEPASNFKNIKIVYFESYGNAGARSITLDTERMTFSGGTYDTVYIDCPFYYANKINCRGGNYSFDTTTSFVLHNGVQFNMESLTTGTNTVTYKGYYTTGANRQASVFIDKIVGINRISGSNA